MDNGHELSNTDNTKMYIGVPMDNRYSRYTS